MGLPLLIHPDILFGFNIENAITKFIYPITIRNYAVTY